MNSSTSCRRFVGLLLLIISVLVAGLPPSMLAQSRRQPPVSDQKKNQRPPDKPPDEPKPEPLPRDIAGKQQDAEKITTTTNLVNVDAVVYNKKTGQPQLALGKDNFAIFVDGVKKDITNFATPEAPITVTLVVAHSKLSEIFGYYVSHGMENS